MVQICNTGTTPALVLDYWLYPGETRSVPAKAVQQLVDTNPHLALCNPVQPPQQVRTESQDAPEPEDQPGEALTTRQRARRK